MTPTFRGKGGRGDKVNVENTKITTENISISVSQLQIKQEFVRPRWPYDMRPSARAEKYMCVIVIR